MAKTIIQLDDVEAIQECETDKLLMLLQARLLTEEILPGHLRWFLAMPADEKTRLMKSSWFVPFTSFKVTVPTNYDHATFLATGTVGQFDRVSGYITDDSFSHATQQLVPGKTYLVKIVKARKLFFVAHDYMKTCLDFLRSQNAILASAHGLLLAYQQAADKFPSNAHVVSFDELTALPVLPRCQDDVISVPYIYPGSGGHRVIDVKYFGDFLGDPYLLFFVDEE